VTQEPEARVARARREGAQRLVRELGTVGAVLMGLGAMIGTGVFVSLGLGAGIAGPAVLVALVIAAGVALCNGLSSAQLAASHPVSGGTYEYGYRYLNSWAGFTAGWVFLVAKSASAATAALGFAGYVLHALQQETVYLVPVALTMVAVLTAIALAELRRSNAANMTIVTVTVSALAFFVAAGVPLLEADNLAPFFAVDGRPVGAAALLEATALMFVAYTGYARIATLGEEVRDPKRTIPTAIVIAAVAVMLLYGAVAVVGIGVAGSGGLRAATEQQAASLAVVAQRFGLPGASTVLTVGALTAMLGVLLNLILGLSRVALAMARRVGAYNGERARHHPPLVGARDRCVGRGDRDDRRRADDVVIQRFQRADLLRPYESCGAADARQRAALPALHRRHRSQRVPRARILGGPRRLARGAFAHRARACVACRRAPARRVTSTVGAPRSATRARARWRP
jgi:basic amino acid/polyamine antiporter, APA family